MSGQFNQSKFTNIKICSIKTQHCSSDNYFLHHCVHVCVCACVCMCVCVCVTDGEKSVYVCLFK